MMIKEVLSLNIFGKLIDCLGLVTLFALMSLIFYVLYDLARDYLKGKLKIKWLCKHEYIETFKWRNTEHTEHTYQCRKCGKILKVDVYEHFSLKDDEYKDDKHETERS